jgi:nucleotide-binding universal stress UspA family protein
LRRLLMGSVADAVLRAARCPVLTIQRPAKGSAEAENHPR